VLPHVERNRDTPIAKITAPDLLSALRKIEGRGTHETAHRTKQRCGQIFRYATATLPSTSSKPGCSSWMRASRIRRQTAEHVFGTLKSWMGSTHFLMKRLPNAQTELSLHVLAYNLKRAMQIFGVVSLIKAIRA
jgi:hypothetical protein